MKGKTLSARLVSLTSVEKSVSSCVETRGAVSFLPVGFPTLRSCFQVFACRSQPATLFSLPELGIKLLEHNFHIPGRGCCLQSHHLLPIWFHAALHSLPRLCPSSPVHSQKIPLSIMQTAPWDLLATRQVRSWVLAPKTHPACGPLIIAHLMTTAALFQIPFTHPSTSPVWAGSGAGLEWHPAENTHPASGYENMGNTKQYVLLSCETACHRKLWVQRDLELAR